MWRIGPIVALIIVAAAAVGALGDRQAPTAPPASLPSPSQAVDRPAAEPAPAPPARPPAPRMAFQFSPTKLTRIRRPPHRPRDHGFGLPGGPYPAQVGVALRDRDCARALSIASHATERSVDYAPLLFDAWSCFDGDQAALLGAATSQHEVFLQLQASFQGPEPQPANPRVPRWRRDPTAGVEYRLHAFMANSDASARLREVIIDHAGAPTVTDTLAQDLRLVLDAAVSVARADAPPADVQEAWAHYVYQSTRILDNPIVSRMLREHRSGDIPAFERLYDEATADRPDRPLPDVVVQAMEQGMSP